MDRVVTRLVEIGGDSTFESLPSSVVEAAKRHLIDAIGCALGGYDEPAAVIARRIASGVSAHKPSTVFGAGRETLAELASFANGVMIRCLDLNDTYASSGGVGHPSDYIAAVLAAGEEVGASGKTVIEAVVAAYDAFGCLTDATNYGVYGWDHVTNGVVASAVGAGKAFGLSEANLAEAVSLAAVANFALHETRLGDVAMWKGCASANACRNGVFAARLAGEGVTGPPKVFEGFSGIIKVAAPKFDMSVIDSPLASHAITQCHLKRYPAGFFSQSAIDAARELCNRVGDPARIKSVRLGTFAFGKSVMAGDAEKWHPVTRESADHSLPFLVATALVYGDVGKQSFTDEALGDPQIARVLAVLEVEEDAECEAAWPHEARNDLTVTLDDGSSERVVVKDYVGHRRNPMSNEGVTEKFLSQASGVLGPEQAQNFLAQLWKLEESTDIGALLASALVPAGR